MWAELAACDAVVPFLKKQSEGTQSITCFTTVFVQLCKIHSLHDDSNNHSTANMTLKLMYHCIFSITSHNVKSDVNRLSKLSSTTVCTLFSASGYKPPLYMMTIAINALGMDLRADAGKSR